MFFTIGRKLALIALMFIIPTIYLVTIFYSEKKKLISFSEKEYYGSKYIDSISDFIILLINQPSDQFSSESTQKINQEINSKLQKAYSDLLEYQNSLGDIFLTKDLIDELKSEFTVSFTELSNKDASNSYSRIFETSLAVIRQVGDQSNMILDPELEPYYCMSVSIIRIPSLLLYLTKINKLVESQFENSSYSEISREILQYRGSLHSVLIDIENDIKRFNNSTNNKDAASELIKFFSTLKKNINQYEKTIESKLGEGDPKDISNSNISYKQVISSVDKIWNISNNLFADLIKIRINNLKLSLVISLIVSFLLIISALIYLYKVSIRIAIPINLLSNTAIEIQKTNNYNLRVNWDSKDEIGIFIKIFTSLLDQLAEELRRSRHEEELKKANLDLENAYSELKQTQIQLIQSGKMALLGQLVAGIAHEVNTPVGAIVAAAGQIKKYYNNCPKEISNLYSVLNPHERELYIELGHSISSLNESNLSTKEIRMVARSINEKLSIYWPDIPNSKCQELASIGFNDTNIENIVQILQSEHRDEVFNSVIEYGMNYMHIRNIEVASSRIAALVTALRSYSHSSSGIKTETDIRADINTTLTIMHSKINQEVNIITEYQNIPKLLSYPEQLNQVWTNLLSNAIQAMYGKGQIIIRVFPQENNIIVEFEDNGPGIKPEVASHLFEPYFTTKQKGDGLGIGLSICREIIIQHNGEISFTTSLDSPSKTCFKIVLPVTTNLN